MVNKVLALFIVGLPLASACSSSGSSTSSPVPCNEDPFQCPSGQTCWTTNAKTFACMPSGSAQDGEACKPLVGPATAPCADGLSCLAATTAGGTCVQYCDPSGTAHGCASGTCTAAAFGSASGPITHVCAGAAPSAPSDAGSD